MEEFTFEIPETEQTGGHPIGMPLFEVIPELQFPRKIEGAVVTVYSGSQEIGEYESFKFAIEILASNVVKITGSSGCSRIIYNATIDVNHY